jgi:hypothetical protein
MIRHTMVFVARAIARAGWRDSAAAHGHTFTERFTERMREAAVGDAAAAGTAIGESASMPW